MILFRIVLLMDKMQSNAKQSNQISKAGSSQLIQLLLDYSKQKITFIMEQNHKRKPRKIIGNDDKIAKCPACIQFQMKNRSSTFDNKFNDR